jgi:hypothetical protein
MKGASDEGTLCRSRKFDMKAFGKDKSAGEPEVDGPATVKEVSPTTPLRLHRQSVL